MQMSQETPIVESETRAADIEGTARTIDIPPTPAEESRPNPRRAEAEAARLRAKQYMETGHFTEAKKALEEAEKLEAESLTANASKHINRFVTGVKSRMQKKSEVKSEEEAKAQVITDRTALAAEEVEKAMKVVSGYSKLAAGVGLLPGFVLNFAGVLAVQIAMVWRIARVFNQDQPHSKYRIRGSIMSLLSSALPATVGHGIGFAVAAIPAVVSGTILSFILAPALAYTLTNAVGKVFIMHFESGGTLLTFDPQEFREHFLKEIRSAGGTPAHSDLAAAV